MHPIDMRAYMHQTEQAIAHTFVNDKLAIHLAGGVQGPHTLTYAIRLYQPTKANVARALSLAPAIEATTGISPIRVYPEQGHILVEVPSPSPVTIRGRTLRGEGLAVPLGMTSRRAIAGIDFEKNPHLLFVGPTGRGKTTAQRLLAFHLAQQMPARHCRFIVSTFKPKDWKAFSDLAHTMALITDPGEAESMIAWLTNLMYQRVRNEVDTPHLFVFMDDLLNLLSVVDLATKLGELASLGRGAGIHLVIGTQRLSERGGGSAVVTGNIPTRLVFGTASAQDSAMFSGRGESGAEKLGRYPGDALFIDDGWVQRLAVAYVDDSDLATLPQNSDEWRPWQKVSPSEIIDRTGSEMERAVNAILSVTPALATEPVLSGSTPVQAGSKPLLTGPARTTLERELVLKIYQRTGSKNQTYKAVWGFKNGDTQQWLNEALGESAT